MLLQKFGHTKKEHVQEKPVRSGACVGKGRTLIALVYALKLLGIVKSPQEDLSKPRKDADGADESRCISINQ